MAELHSTRTRIFLFTDIEGSTQRWESDRDAMSAALARHDAILRASIKAHDGQVFKSIGDAFCAAFGSTADALVAALEAQRALAAEDWSAFGPDSTALAVRMAVHAGVAERRDDDYFGPPLNHIARLLSAAHGGQILLSAVAEGLLAGRLPESTHLRDHGTHRLRDLGRPEPVFQLCARDLPTDFPPLASLNARPHNLPVQLTSFVGREGELAEIVTLLGDPAGPHLLRLTGPGGTGKTRLAQQAAADLVDDFAHGVRFVDLAPLVDPDLVAPTIASALAIEDRPGQDSLDRLIEWLAERRLLSAEPGVWNYAGRATLALGQVDDAETFFREGLAVAAADDIMDLLIWNLDGLASSALQQGRFDRAARLLGGASRLREAYHCALEPAEAPRRERSMCALRAALGEPGAAAFLAEGRALDKRSILALALRDELDA